MDSLVGIIIKFICEKSCSHLNAEIVLCLKAALAIRVMGRYRKKLGAVLGPFTKFSLRKRASSQNYI